MSVRGFAVEGIEKMASDPITDSIIDFEVTANRPDAMSVLGMAREVATAYALPLKPAAGSRQSAATGSSEPADLDVVIENAMLGPRYVGAVADVTVGPSPSWMQGRLQAAGIRPISNIVDVTNYVLLELGHPMHAFDLARLAKSQIRVRTARAGETIKTLDGQTRTLKPDMLVIADGERPVAVAGVMGGAESEVTERTRTIVLESACFNPLSVRRTSRKLGLKTEASMRFERGSDPMLPVTAMQRACALLQIAGAGMARGTVIDRHPQPRTPVSLPLRRVKLAGLLGFSIPDDDVQRILASLGCGVTSTAGG